MRPNRSRLIITMAVALLLALVPVAVMAAGGQFTDDDDSIFEADIEWMAASGVTAGCNPPANDNYCPDKSVTRGQMAAFMHRFAQYLGAEDGTPALADSATTADSAATADYATDAGTVDGKNAYQFQPTTNDFEATATTSVNANNKYEIASGTVSTTDGSGLVCLTPSTPTADVRISASAYVTSLVGLDATFWLEDSSGQISGTVRKVSDSGNSFATEWLYESSGGMETFTLVANEGGGDTFSVHDASIFVEVISDTRCKGSGGVIILPGEPASDDPDLQF